MGAGSGGGYTKRIVGLESVISDLETLFDGGKIWPRLATREDEPAPPSFYRYKPISPTDDYLRVAPGLSARVMPVSHGTCEQADGGVYESSAYFIRNDRTTREFLFFGDVEPDSVSKLPQTRAVWRFTARYCVSGVLVAIGAWSRSTIWASDTCVYS
jgi:cAMP phosphodiesterase